MIGTTIGNFRIIAELGGGAMGDVFYAEHVSIGSRAAIKVLRESLGVDQDMLVRFFNEAKAVNAIRHPNIVDITDFGSVGARHYIMMELLEGETLDERIEVAKKLTPEEAAHISGQICSAVGAAHVRGIIHRDLKPENVFLTNHPDYPDYVKVLDFGIAKLTASPTGRERTQAGALLGTPAYMSPEQCRGDQDLDHRSDIYTLGVMLYQMVSGRLPHEGGSLAELIGAHLQDDPTPLLELEPSLPEAFAACVMATLSKDPKHRPQSMQELRETLDKAVGKQQAKPAILKKQRAGKPKSKRTTLNRRRTVVDKHAIGSFATDKVGGELTKIILERVHSDRLVLPAMPHSVAKTLELLRNPNVSFADIAQTLEQDPIIAPQLLRVANSPAYLGAARAASLEQAIGRLGFEQTRTLMIQVSAHKIFRSRDKKIRQAFQGLWDHSLAVAAMSRRIAKITSSETEPAIAYMAGLLNDVGRPIAGALLLEAEKLLGKKKDSWMNEAIWMQVIQDCHQEIGATVAQRWSLADEIAASIAATDYDIGAPLSCTNIVHLASALALRAGIMGTKHDPDELAETVETGKLLLQLSDIALDGVVGEIDGVVAEKAGSTARVA